MNSCCRPLVFDANAVNDALLVGPMFYGVMPGQNLPMSMQARQDLERFGMHIGIVLKVGNPIN